MKKLISATLMSLFVLSLAACNPSNGSDFDDRGLVSDDCTGMANIDDWQPVWCSEFDENGLPSNDYWGYDVGGGGWGNPLERDPEEVFSDVRKGLVSAEGARRYGVVFNVGGQVDEAATQTLRQELASSRNTDELFSRGGTIEVIMARCEAETGLPAPATPTWAHRGAV
jgi:hypothetical protein